MVYTLSKVNGGSSSAKATTSGTFAGIPLTGSKGSSLAACGDGNHRLCLENGTCSGCEDDTFWDNKCSSVNVSHDVGRCMDGSSENSPWNHGESEMFVRCMQTHADGHTNQRNAISTCMKLFKSDFGIDLYGNKRFTDCTSQFDSMLGTLNSEWCSKRAACTGGAGTDACTSAIDDIVTSCGTSESSCATNIKETVGKACTRHIEVDVLPQENALFARDFRNDRLQLVMGEDGKCTRALHG